MNKIIYILLLLVSLQGCATVYTSRMAYEKEYAKMEKIISATESVEGSVNLCVQGKKYENMESMVYTISLPKDIISQYSISINKKVESNSNDYLIENMFRGIGSESIHSIHKYMFSSKAVKSSCRPQDVNSSVNLNVSNLGYKHCKVLLNSIDELPTLKGQLGNAAVFELPCCRNDCVSLIIVPSGKDIYPFELSGGGSEAMTKPYYLLLLPLSIGLDFITSPLQLVAMLIEIGIHL